LQWPETTIFRETTMNPTDPKKMTAPQTGTSLVAPATDAPTAPKTEQQMVAPPAAKRLVKIRANQPIAYGDVTLAAGQEAEVSEEMAKEFCDRHFEGNYAFGGERSSESGAAERHRLTRAVRV
jgi:hypothetical protein